MKRILSLGLIATLAACSPEAEPEDQGEETATKASTPEPDAAEVMLTQHMQVVPGQAAPSGDFVPSDNCAQRDGGAEFRHSLAEAVIARDADALVALADPAIKLDFGGGSGPALLRERLADPNYELWTELEKILPLGCSSDADNLMIMPAYFTHDFGTLDPFAIAIVMGNGVPLYMSPDDAGGTVGTLDWAAVEMVEPPAADAKFAQVKTLDGSEGYIATDAMRYLLDYRILANKIDGEWRMTALIAGD